MIEALFLRSACISDLSHKWRLSVGSFSFRPPLPPPPTVQRVQIGGGVDFHTITGVEFIIQKISIKQCSKLVVLLKRIVIETIETTLRPFCASCLESDVLLLVAGV